MKNAYIILIKKSEGKRPEGISLQLSTYYPLNKGPSLQR
jgi:hypothetical protein